MPRSPSPRPSPRVEGVTLPLSAPTSVFGGMSAAVFSLSPRERAGVRGNTIPACAVATIPRTTLGFNPFTASANTLICAGVVPQQPPTRFNHPFSAHSYRAQMAKLLPADTALVVHVDIRGLQEFGHLG